MLERNPQKLGMWDILTFRCILDILMKGGVFGFKPWTAVQKGSVEKCCPKSVWKVLFEKGLVRISVVVEEVADRLLSSWLVLLTFGLSFRIYSHISTLQIPQVCRFPRNHNSVDFWNFRILWNEGLNKQVFLRNVLNIKSHKNLNKNYHEAKITVFNFLFNILISFTADDFLIRQNLTCAQKRGKYLQCVASKVQCIIIGEFRNSFLVMAATLERWKIAELHLETGRQLWMVTYFGMKFKEFGVLPYCWKVCTRHSPSLWVLADHIRSMQTEKMTEVHKFRNRGSFRISCKRNLEKLNWHSKFKLLELKIFRSIIEIVGFKWLLLHPIGYTLFTKIFLQKGADFCENDYSSSKYELILWQIFQFF